MTKPNIRICEQCDHGYHINATNCPHCGCSSMMSHTAARSIEILDLEVYKDYFLCKFEHSGEFQLFPGSQPLDVQTVSRILSKITIVTFNGNSFDIPVLTYACNGATNEQIKQACDAIIQQGLRSWQFYDAYGLQRPDWIDHIDLIEVSPGQASLKAYGGKMHSRKIQDLPIQPDASIKWHDRVALREYCGNDIATTRDLYNTLREQIKLREGMSEQYGIDLRSKSDAQIAEAILKSQLGFKVECPNVPAGTVIRYFAPEWISFVTPQLQSVLKTVQDALYVIGTNGSPGLPPSLEALDIQIGQSKYTLQIGGLHSCEKSVSRYADDEVFLRDVDVASFYPNLIRNMRLYPRQIGPVFNDIYSGWIDRRLAAKAAGDKVTADSLKTLVNGTFGKTGSIWSILYAPDMMLSVTLSGQLALLMLIEMLELQNISVVSANTDGIVVQCHRQLEWIMKETCNWWQKKTNLELEAADYASVHSRDVNSYIALKSDGKVKLKGAFAPPKIVGPSWPNPTSEVCTDAVVAYLRDGTPLEKTIRACHDVRKFASIRAVRGGGEWVRRIGPPVDAGVRAQRSVLTEAGWVQISAKPEMWRCGGELPVPRDEAYRTLIVETDVEYLGKVARWYYALPDGGSTQIRYIGKGNLVAGTDGCWPLMALPDSLPGDIDYARYVQIARDLLVDTGVNLG